MSYETSERRTLRAALATARADGPRDGGDELRNLADDTAMVERILDGSP